QSHHPSTSLDSYDGQGTHPKTGHRGNSPTNSGPPQCHGWPTKSHSPSCPQPHGASQTITLQWDPWHHFQVFCWPDWPPSCTYPKCFPTKNSKVVRTWTKSSMGNQWWPCGTSARLELCRHTQDFNQHAHTMGWADTPLMSLYQHGLKEKIQLAVVMSNIEFYSLRSMKAMALKAGQTIEVIQQDHPATLSPVPVPKAPSNQLSGAKQSRQVQQNLCFFGCQVGHISSGCLNGVGNPKTAYKPHLPLGSPNFRWKSIVSTPTPAPVAPPRFLKTR
ncbi:uncharacterized protein VP01_7176g1, partial [Puccinia sorghi]